MRCKVFAAAVVGGALSFLVPASASAAGWTPPLTITSAFTEDSDLVVVYTSGGGVYTTNCAANQWIFVVSNEDRHARG